MLYHSRMGLKERRRRKKKIVCFQSSFIDGREIEASIPSWIIHRIFLLNSFFLTSSNLHFNELLYREGGISIESTSHSTSINLLYNSKIISIFNLNLDFGFVFSLSSTCSTSFAPSSSFGELRPPLNERLKAELLTRGQLPKQPTRKLRLKNHCRVTISIPIPRKTKFTTIVLFSSSSYFLRPIQSLKTLSSDSNAPSTTDQDHQSSNPLNQTEKL